MIKITLDKFDKSASMEDESAVTLRAYTEIFFGLLLCVGFKEDDISEYIKLEGE